MAAGGKRGGVGRIRRLQQKDRAEKRKAKKMHKALLSGDTLYDALLIWAGKNLPAADVSTLRHLLEKGARYPVPHSELNKAAVVRLRNLGLVAKIEDVCILAKRQSISKCMAQKVEKIYKKKPALQ